MPVYNAEKYLAEAVESVLSQTFADYEFIIVDDGSTDGSLAVLKEYAAQDLRIRIISRPNTGYVVALNEMLALARGEFIARMDADDSCFPDRFEHQVAFLRAHENVNCVGGAFLIIDDLGRPLTTFHGPTDNATIQDLALSGHTPLCHPTIMMRRGAVVSVGGYRTHMEPAEDIDLYLRLGEFGELASLERAVLKYREHASSVSNLRQKVQLERMKDASDQACDRRGIARRMTTTNAPFRAGSDRLSRHKFALRNGWWAFSNGARMTALDYACRSIRLLPWRLDGWRLLISVLVKPSRKHDDTSSVSADARV